jgi:hypothetical protein
MLFSYGCYDAGPRKNDRLIWTYNVEKREWTSQTPDFGESKIKLNFSAQIACAPPLKQVYLIGGSKDKNFN